MLIALAALLAVGLIAAFAVALGRAASRGDDDLDRRDAARHGSESRAAKVTRTETTQTETTAGTAQAGTGSPSYAGLAGDQLPVEPGVSATAPSSGRWAGVRR